MKKVAAAVSAAVLVVSLVSMVFAAEAKKGTIKSVDAAAGTMVFCPEGGKDETLKADKSVDLSKVKAGKAEVSVEAGTVTGVKALKAKAAMGC